MSALPEAGSSRSLPGVLFFGFALSSIGGPLALVSLSAGAAGSALSSAGFTTALGALWFVFPLFVWYRYSERIAAAGGLYAFAEAAAGRRAARVQGVVWTIAYFLYLPYTVTFIVYDLLPTVFPGVSPYRPALELLLPVALVGAVLARLNGLLVVLLLAAAVQLLLLLALGGLQLAQVGAPLRSFVPHAGASAIGRGAANVSLLFICASLPLFLGGEVRGGARTVRLALLASFLIVAPYLVFAAFPLSRASSAIRESVLPGFALAQAYGNRPLAVLVGVFTMTSIAGLIVAEYIALSRLVHAMLGTTIRRTLAWIAVPFVLADVLSLIDPDEFYAQLLRPSLAALYVSQLIVFVAYPLFRRRYARLLAVDLVSAATAAGLMVWGFYALVTNQLGGS